MSPLADSPYRWLLLTGILVSLVVWARMAGREPRMIAVYVGGLLGAFTGAKLVYLAAEGWMFWDSPERWLIWATGKTILGALLGGYAGVEIAKKTVGYAKPTGDLWAIVAPVSIILGRVGCVLHGCCPGVECPPAWWTIRDSHGSDRWPSAFAEIVFNLIAFSLFIVMRRHPVWPTQHFHLYLIGYGTFRFFHEFLRATPRIALGFSGYQVAALACVALGVWGFRRRQELRLKS